MSAKFPNSLTADHARLGAYLCSVRIEAGFSQEELAVKLNVPQSYVSKLERGERQLRVLELISICEVFKIESSKFIDSFRDLEPGLDLPLTRVTRLRPAKKRSKEGRSN